MSAKKTSNRVFYLIRGAGRSMAFYNRAILDVAPVNAAAEFSVARRTISSASKQAEKRIAKIVEQRMCEAE